MQQERQPSLPPDFGQRLRRLRELRGLSQYRLAKMAGLTSPAVLQIEAGKRKNPPYSTLAALAEALDVTIDGLAGRSRRGKRNPLRDKDIGVVVHKMTRMSTEMRALVREYVDTLREKGQTPV